MLNFAAKLKGSHKNNQTSPASAIFGEVSPGSKLSQSDNVRLRIGLWPIQSQSEPFLAMGLSMLIGFLLERWPSMKVYRLPAQVEGDPLDYKWTIEKSQFGVDDWELDDLDENAALWGTFGRNQSHYTLTLEFENDLANDEAMLQAWEAESLSELVNLLPQIAETVAEYLGAGEVNPKYPTFQSSQWHEDDLKKILEAAFEWELNLYLYLWGKNWANEQMLADFKKLLILGQTLDSDLGDWIASNAIAHVLSPLYSILDTNLPLLEYAEKSSAEANTGSLYRHTVALALYHAGYSVRAFDLLELNVENFPKNLISWMTLAELYWQAGEIGTALNTIQRAIQAKITSVEVYIRYAEMLLAFDLSNLLIKAGTRRTSSTGRTFVENFILISADETKVNHLGYEAARAYEYALRIEPNNAEILSHLVIQLIDLRDLSLWVQFEKLIEVDKESLYTRNVIEAMSSLEDIKPAISILSRDAQKNTNQIQTHINLAIIYMLDGKHTQARSEFVTAQNLANDNEINAEIERLLLSADNPDFDERLSEINDLLNSGSKIKADDVEFLELALEKAPAFATGYVLLAKAYLIWNEITDALDVLLDGQRQLPDDPDISALLASVLWHEGETQLAFDCLNKSLSKNPDHVPTLAMTGRFLFEDAQENEAKLFLARAEAIDPHNKVLSDTRVYIASMINNLRTD